MLQVIAATCLTSYTLCIKNKLISVLVVRNREGYGCLLWLMCNTGDCVFCLITSMSQLMQHHGCRSHLRDRNKLTGLDDRFDMVVDANDVILENVVSIYFPISSIQQMGREFCL